MIDRFKEPRLLREALLYQQSVANEAAIADALVPSGTLVHLAPKGILMTQDGIDNEIHFLLAGRVAIIVNGREMGIRIAGQHVGEMALIDTAARRSATVLALDELVTFKVPEHSFTPIANQFPQVWRRLALELGNRLRERSKHVQAPNPRPVVFIGSSAEGLAVANEIQAGLSHDDVVPQVWVNNVFVPGHGTMEDLEERIATADFGVLVCTPDDHVTHDKRHVDSPAPRDNVICELGMCLGALRRKRVFLVKPRGVDLKIPTDYLGITPIDYVADDPKNLSAHIGPVCTAIRKVIKASGVR